MISVCNCFVSLFLVPSADDLLMFSVRVLSTDDLLMFLRYFVFVLFLEVF